MESAPVMGLINNVALLLALGVLYDLLNRRIKSSGILRQLTTGTIAGGIGVAVMMNPWHFSPGVVFEARSILPSVGGLFFGFIPALIAGLVTRAYRLYQGGMGAWTGVGVIVTSAGGGVLWRNLRKTGLEKITSLELFAVGVTVHLLMLLWMLPLPAPVGFRVLSNISLPVMILFPLATIALGKLLSSQMKSAVLQQALEQSEEKYRQLVQDANSAVLRFDRSGRMTFQGFMEVAGQIGDYWLTLNVGPPDL